MARKLKPAEPEPEVLADLEDAFSKGSWAVVWEPEKGWSLMVPKKDEKATVPAQAMALTGFLFRIEHDNSFQEEMIDYFVEQAKKAS